MTLFHNFPRKLRSATDSISLNLAFHETDVLSRGIEILRSISKYGLLCSPEWLPFSNRATQPIGGTGPISHQDLGRFSQSRFCVTAIDASEIYVRRNRDKTDSADALMSHAEAFGPFTIGFSDDLARKIGFMPTIYYTPVNSHGKLHMGSGVQDPGVNLQLLQSLHDIRNILKSLLIIEHEFAKYDEDISLDKFDISHIIKNDSMELPAFDIARSCGKEILDLITDPFNFRRLPALNLLDHLEIALTLFQSTDDLQTRVPMVYFQQREWRLVQHFRRSLYWYSLGDHPESVDENRKSRGNQRLALARRVNRQKEYLNACWVLESLDQTPIRDLISFVSMPKRALSLMAADITELFPSANFVVAEELGYRESGS